MNSLAFQNQVDHEQLRNSKYLSIVGSISYPTWHFIFLYFNPDIYDPLLSRIICYTFLWVSAAYLFFTKTTGIRTTSMMFLAAASISTHHFYVAYMNDISLLYTAGGLIIVPAVISSMPSLHSSLIFGLLFIIIPNAFTMILAKQPLQWFYGLGLSTVSLLMCLMQYSRFRMMKMLQQSVKHQEWMLGNLVEGVVLKDRDGRIFAANPAAEKILEMRESELKGLAANSSKFSFVYDDGSHRDGDTCPSMVALRTGVKQLDQPLAIKRADGSITWISINAQPIYHEGDATPSAVLVSFFDTTERRNAEKLLKDQQARMVSSSKMSALGEMAAGIAHEINNPLAIISGRINQIQRYLDKKQDDPTKLASLFKNVEDTVARISKIVQSLRSFARDGQTDPYSAWQISKIVDETLVLCKERFVKSGVELDVHNPHESLSIECRPSEISQILLNLLQNSFDAIQDLERAKKISIAVFDIGSNIEIHVSDNGPGISKDVRDKIMQPFFTTKPIGKGTGLGLSVSMGIAESHNGRLFLKDDAKTTFCLSLPKRQLAQRKPAA